MNKPSRTYIYQGKKNIENVKHHLVKPKAPITVPKMAGDRYYEAIHQHYLFVLEKLDDEVY